MTGKNRDRHGSSPGATLRHRVASDPTLRHRGFSAGPLDEAHRTTNAHRPQGRPTSAISPIAQHASPPTSSSPLSSSPAADGLSPLSPFLRSQQKGKQRSHRHSSASTSLNNLNPPQKPPKMNRGQPPPRPLPPGQPRPVDLQQQNLDRYQARTVTPIVQDYLRKRMEASSGNDEPKATTL